MAKTAKNSKVIGRAGGSNYTGASTVIMRDTNKNIKSNKKAIESIPIGNDTESKVPNQSRKRDRNFDARVYVELLVDVIPKVIKSREEYERLEAKFEELLDRGEERTPEQDSLFDLLATLLRDYEKRTLPVLQTTSPVSTLRFLMEQNKLNQIDMVEYFGSQGNVSQILSGKRTISIKAARKLGVRFKLSADIFIR